MKYTSRGRRQRTCSELSKKSLRQVILFTYNPYDIRRMRTNVVFLLLLLMIKMEKVQTKASDSPQCNDMYDGKPTHKIECITTAQSMCMT